MPLRLEQRDADVLLWIKAVPGASRDQLAGAVGDRLKVRVNAPAEAGRANDAIRALFARTLDRKLREITIDSGHASPEKIIRIASASAAEIRARLEQ